MAGFSTYMVLMEVVFMLLGVRNGTGSLGALCCCGLALWINGAVTRLGGNECGVTAFGTPRSKPLWRSILLATQVLRLDTEVIRY